MRPRSFEEFVGQDHILGPGKLLRRTIEAGKIGSVIFYGPPGSGKTSLARVIASVTQSAFVQLSAVTSGVRDIRSIGEAARQSLRAAPLARTILFVDEVHRFNKSQQDVLLPYVEKGILSLIGTTTQNPFFYINAALVSRSRVFEFRPLSNQEIETLLRRALTYPERGLGQFKVNITKEAIDHLVASSEGDVRRALNALEVAVVSTPPGEDGTVEIGLGAAEDSIQKKAVLYDRDGDAHYDTISAFIKSMRGSDPDAAVYWLAKMLHAGEDPRFIARRIIICAAEDVGNADPQALVLAAAALQAVEFVGMPEAQIPLAQAAIYVATAPKSNSSYTAISKALADVAEERTHAVPEHLRDASYPGAKRLGRGEGYRYPHDYPEHIVEQVYLPREAMYYEPSSEGYEKEIARRIENWKQKLKFAMESPSSEKP
ncbi:MAG: replication-associated recombination protein A [bacterium]|nr:replication-associated recombination protein A [bacterium]